MILTLIPLFIGLGVLLVLLVIAAVISRMALHIASPDQALVISSKDNKSQPDPNSQRVVFGRHQAPSHRRGPSQGWWRRGLCP